MKTNKIIVFLLLFMLSVSLSACTKTKASENDDISVKTTKAKISKIRNGLEYSGNLEGIKESLIATKVPGQIKTIEVSIGDKIKEKQILARLSGEENYTSQNTAYISYQNSMANLQNTNQAMDQKIKGAEVALETAQKNLLAVKTADANEDDVSKKLVDDTKLSLELLEINLANIDNSYTQKNNDILDSVQISINQADILLKDMLTYLYSLNDKNLPDTFNNFDINDDFSIANPRNEDLARHAILIFKTNYYKKKAIISNNVDLSKENVLAKRDATEELLNLAKEAIEKMNVVVADSVASITTSQNELDAYRNVLSSYSKNISNMLLSQDNGQAVGIIGVRQQLDNLQIEKDNTRRELEKKIEQAENAITLLESKVKTTQDDLEAKITIAESQVKQAKVGLADAKKSKSLQEQATKTQVDLARGGLNMANVQADNTLLKSPYDGVVMEKLQEEGVVVNAGTPILKVADISSYKLVVYIPETEIINIKIGQVGDLTIESFLEEKIKAKVERISPKIEESSNKVRVELSLEKRDFFKIGMYATVRFNTETKQAVLLLPLEALHNLYGENFVYTVNEGKVEIKKVETGKKNEGMIEIRDGVDESDKVILGEVASLKTGDNVRIVN